MAGGEKKRLTLEDRARLLNTAAEFDPGPQTDIPRYAPRPVKPAPPEPKVRPVAREDTTPVEDEPQEAQPLKPGYYLLGFWLAVDAVGVAFAPKELGLVGMIDYSVRAFYSWVFVIPVQAYFSNFSVVWNHVNDWVPLRGIGNFLAVIVVAIYAVAIPFTYGCLLYFTAAVYGIYKCLRGYKFYDIDDDDDVFYGWAAAGVLALPFVIWLLALFVGYLFERKDPPPPVNSMLGFWR